MKSFQIFFASVIVSPASLFAGYSAAVLADNPVAYYRFGADGTQDSSVNANHGTAAGGINFGLNDGFDGGAQFNGTDSRIEFAPGTFDSLLQGASAITFSFWVDLDSIPDGTSNKTFLMIPKSGGGAGLTTRFGNPSGSNSLFWAVGGRSENSQNKFTEESITLNDTFSGLVHLAAVVDYTNDAFRYYANGLLIGTDSVFGTDEDFTSSTYQANVAGGDENAWIGRNVSGSSYFGAGVVDEFALFNYDLGDAGIAEQFAAGTVPEPETYSLLLGVLVAGWVTIRRRS